MAGTYLHLLLAHQALERLDEATDLHGAEAAFFAGVVGPDIGFFPGGPRALSDSIHRYHAADLVRGLHDLAQTPAERGFAAGWALHVYTDLAVHPEIEARSHRLQSDHPLAAGTDAWHKRIEWGLDCQVLESTPLRLWQLPLAFPFTPSSAGLLERAASPLFGALAEAAAIDAGGRAATRLTRRLAPALLWTGGCRRPDRGRLCRLVAAIANPWARRLSTAWEQNPDRDDEVAILWPWREEEHLVQQLRSLATASISTFLDGLRQGHVQLENRDLSTGELTPAIEDEI